MEIFQSVAKSDMRKKIIGINERWTFNGGCCSDSITTGYNSREKKPVLGYAFSKIGSPKLNRKVKRPTFWVSLFMAESKRFELSEPAKVRRFSRPVLSTTQPTLRRPIYVRWLCEATLDRVKLEKLLKALA